MQTLVTAGIQSSYMYLLTCSFSPLYPQQWWSSSWKL